MSKLVKERIARAVITDYFRLPGSVENRMINILVAGKVNLLKKVCEDFYPTRFIVYTEISPITLCTLMCKHYRTTIWALDMFGGVGGVNTKDE